jgi:phosphate transport system permease protein
MTHREGAGGTAPRWRLLPGPHPTPGRGDRPAGGFSPALARFTGSRASQADAVFKGITIAFAALVIFLVFGIVGSLVYQSQEAWATLGIGALFGDEWLPGGQPPRYGSWPLVLGTLVTSFLAVLIGVPVSLGIAIYLAEMAPPWVRGPVSVVVELLAAIPSVVYGLWGIFFLAPFLYGTVYPRLQANWGWTGLFSGQSTGYSVMTAGILLAIMIIPTVSAISREVFRAVPGSQREAAYAIGATKWEVVRKAVIPYGRTGLFGAAILGLARAVGETMAVTMVIGNRNAVFGGLLEPGNTIPSVLANETYEATGVHLSALFALGVILFIVALVINIAARLLVAQVTKKSGSVAA